MVSILVNVKRKFTQSQKKKIQFQTISFVAKCVQDSYITS